MAFAGMKVGDLAKRAGVTVRTLHHYDRLGLVVPSMRTGAGHRLYGERDLRRLAAVVMLRGMGMSLEEIKKSLSARGKTGAAGMLELMGRRAAAMKAQMEQWLDAHERLEGLMRLMKSAGKVSAEDCLELLEMMSMMENYYTPEQLEQLKQRRETLWPEAIGAAEKEWPELMAKMKQELDAGTDPTHLRVQVLARRWKELVEMFTGGDPGIAKAVGKLWKEKGNEMAGKMNMPWDPKMFEYVRKAQEHMSI
jgi:MerR family transcriptional regulator, thiopeptide resistance regulator